MAAALYDHRQPGVHQVVGHQVDDEDEPHQHGHRRPAVAEQRRRRAAGAGAALGGIEREVRRGRDGHILIELAREPRHRRIAAAAQHQELDRLGQHEDQAQPHHQRRDAADDEDHRPAVGGHQRGADDAGNGAAQRNPHRHHHQHGGAQALRRELGIERDHVGEHAAEPEPAEKAQPQQLLDVGGPGAGERGEPDEDQARHDREAAAEAVAEVAEERRADEKADQARTEHRAECGPADAPFLDQRRTRDAGVQQVEAVGHHRQQAPEGQPEMERPQPGRVHQAADIDLVHCCSSRCALLIALLGRRTGGNRRPDEARAGRLKANPPRCCQRACAKGNRSPGATSAPRLLWHRGEHRGGWG